ncbi:MAG: LapA family protein [Gammaproteobacteria bacterium]|nr:LapA family protein [Gammaproteobacteria bacterium]MBU2479119.1 LapA family protein [Gammaproteobacteria bacterium]
MSRLVSLVLLLALVLVGLAFAVVNSKPVELNYFLATREVPLAMTLVLTLAFGALIGLFFSLGMVIRLKRETLRLRRQMQIAEQEVVNLRNIPIKDTH